jgi:hypothetical protein
MFFPLQYLCFGEWRKLHNEELNDLYSSPNRSIVRMIKLGRMRWAGPTLRVWERDTGFWLGHLTERDHLGDPGVDGRIISRRVFRKMGVGCGGMDWIELTHDRYRWRVLVTAVMNLRVP